MSEEKVVLGKISSPHGVTGSFKFTPYNLSFEKELSSYKNLLFLENRSIDINILFKKNKTFICKSSLFSSKTELLNFLGKEIWTNYTSLKTPNKNEYFHKDLVDCKVYDQQLNELGKVKAVHNFGAGDLLELNNNFKFMIRFYDLKDDDIRIKEKKIILHSMYQL